MKIIYADIFDEIKKTEEVVVVHGCNCFCNMGAGIALDLKRQFPQVYLADTLTEKGSRNKLGTYSYAVIESHQTTIINAYTQYHWKGIGILADYHAIRAVFKRIKKDYSGKKIIYPKIGSGLARGNWKKIADIIDDELGDELHYCVALEA